MARRSFAGGLRGRDMPARQAPLESSPIRMPSGLNTMTPPVPSAPHRCGPTVTIGPADEPRNSGGAWPELSIFCLLRAHWESAAGQKRHTASTAACPLPPSADMLPISLTIPGKKNSLAVTLAPTTGSSPLLVAPAHAEFYDLISRSIVSMAASILANDLPARILASA
jgi:hypothetical protein